MIYKEFESDILALSSAATPPRMIEEDGKLKRAVPEIPAQRLQLARQRLANLSGLQVVEELVARAQKGFRLNLGI